MKTNYSKMKVLIIFTIISLFLLPVVLHAQVTERPDTLIIMSVDSAKVVLTDTVIVTPAEPVKPVEIAPVVAPAVIPTEMPAETPEAKPQEMNQQAVEETKKTEEDKPAGEKDKGKDKKGKKNEIVFYTGANFTKLAASDAYETENGVGYQLGAYYKQGRFFYWQVGARYASSKIGYKPGGSPASTDFGSITVSDLDFPLSLGLNFTSFMNRVLSVRVFASAVPSVTLNVGDNTYGIDKDHVESFVMYGQGGIGVNVAFVVLEAGYNFGFNELLVGNSDSKPGQVFVNLGFRF